MGPVVTYRRAAPLAKAEAVVQSALKEEGFGILTEVDVTATLRDKLSTVGEQLAPAPDPA